MEPEPKEFWLDAKLCIRAHDESHAKEQLDAVLRGWCAATLQSDYGLSMFDRTGLAQEEDK